MNRALRNLKKIEKYRQSFRGVFTLGDLKNLLSAVSPVDFYRQIETLKDNEILFPFVRGIYVCAGFDLEVVSQKLCADSYVSLAGVLAEKAVIGTIPKNVVYAVKLGKARTYESSFGTVVHLGISPRLFFGFQARNGVNYADKEKAFLDTLYFYQKGLKLYFNVYQDINIALLDRRKVTTYLKSYKNPRFVEFAKGVLRA